MTQIDFSEYSRMRKRLLSLHSKAVKNLTRSELMSAAEELGILEDDNTLVLDSEDEMSVMMDFAIYEIQRDGVSIIQCYLRENPLRDGVSIVRRNRRNNRLRDKDVREAVCGAFTSLFIIEEIEDDRLELVDLLDSGHPSYELVDIGFLNSAPPGLLVFSRLLPLPTYHITSGAALCFPESERRKLVRSYQRMAKGLAEPQLAARRFRFFHRESKRSGIETAYL